MSGETLIRFKPNHGELVSLVDCRLGARRSGGTHVAKLRRQQKLSLPGGGVARSEEERLVACRYSPGGWTAGAREPIPTARAAPEPLIRPGRAPGAKASNLLAWPGWRSGDGLYTAGHFPP